jgi:plastocyanin
MRRRYLGPVILAAALVLPLAACGGDSGSSSGTTVPPDVTVHAMDALKFDSSTYTAKSNNGKVNILYVDDGSATHTLRIDGVDNFRLQVTGKGDHDEGTATLAPGDYTIYCDIPGHREAGMEATLTVT